MAVEINAYHPASVARSIQASTALVPDAVTAAQYAEERFFAIATGQANPPFRLTKDRNALVENGGSISRGYIRRADINGGDATSGYRLYFMFNPPDIQRSYIAYLDQQALDPGNALFGSNNMAAPPGLLDFSFPLLFDRQLEVASDPNHPGTKVDYDYFDLVVRGVVPDGIAAGNAIPDNGIMMVNPHSVVIVFGQDLSVHGRVTNASINFEKFNNRMIPTRLRIGISMKALYIGPVQTIPNYSLFNNENISQATIPYENTVVEVFEEIITPVSFSKAFQNSFNRGQHPSSSIQSGAGGAGVLTIPQAIMYARGAGFTGEALVHIVAIAIRESGLNSLATGDTTITNAKWGPSTGLTQIRSLNAELNTGGVRDAQANYDPAIHMAHAFSISGGGTNFGPWSTNAGWEQNRGPVDDAIRAGA